MHAVLAACGGFLLAVLWFDLMFDVQVLSHPDGLLPEAVLASIAEYYRRVTTEAFPMNRLVGVFMLVAVGGSAAQLLRQRVSLLLGLAALASCLLPVGLAVVRVVPAAVRLGSRADPPEVQSRMARAICRDHLLCLAGIAVFLALQLVS
jgi:hypothetical protein